MNEEVLTITIANRPYKIKLGSQDPRYIKSLAHYVDQKIKSLQDLYPSLDFQKLLVLTCLNVTDDFLQSRKASSTDKDFLQQLTELKNILEQ